MIEIEEPGPTRTQKFNKAWIKNNDISIIIILFLLQSLILLSYNL